MKTNPVTVADLLVGAGVAVVGAVLSAIALTTLSRPANLEDRVAVVEQQMQQAARLLRQEGPSNAFPPEAACGDDVAAEAERLRLVLVRAADTFRLEKTSIVVQQDAAAAPGRLVPLKVTFEASGQYEGALGALDHLSTLRPIVFLESVDLVSKTSFVNVAFVGRAFCSVR